MSRGSLSLLFFTFFGACGEGGREGGGEKEIQNHELGSDECYYHAGMYAEGPSEALEV